MKKAFTLIELVFVIAIIGILASIALPNFIGSRDDAIITRTKTQVLSIISGISTDKTANILGAKTDVYPQSLEKSNSNYLFDAVLQTGIIDAGENNDGWHKAGEPKKCDQDINGKNCRDYTIRLKNNASAIFTYDNKKGTFTCSNPNPTDLCNKLTK